MGMMKGFIHEWLEDFGFELGYDWDNLPSLSDMNADTPPAWENN